jgi:hypothetical protein
VSCHWAPYALLLWQVTQQRAELLQAPSLLLLVTGQETLLRGVEVVIELWSRAVACLQAPPKYLSTLPLPLLVIPAYHWNDRTKLQSTLGRYRNA